MLALVGQGFWVALLQAVLFYYAAGAAIHWVIPRLAPVRSIQKHARGAHDVRRDALFSLGAIQLPCSSACTGARSRQAGPPPRRRRQAGLCTHVSLL